jgi:hypothetical protein
MVRQKRLDIIDGLFDPNVDGVSREVSVTEIEEVGLPWTKNGNIRHGIPWNDDRYLWEFIRGSRREILGMKMVGWNPKRIERSRPIRNDIREALQNEPCVVCGSRSSIIIDHKNDLYNDLRVLDASTQTIDDFQPLCNHCNLQKRQVSVEMRRSGKRYPATNIPSVAVFGVDFILGDETYDPEDPNATVGSYWHDPVAFLEVVHELKNGM